MSILKKLDWELKKAKFTKNKGKVFSCFSCGGGSTMGYKLAGYDVIGFNEIDKNIAETYILNHNPKLKYIMPISEMLDIELDKELYDLDILDGSPPCSSFSISGSREKNWGKMKKFKEGQQEQILDELFFDFIALADKLQPKVVIAENVKGLLQKSSLKYIQRIYKDFEKAGYYCQHFLLNSKNMEVPQKRERVFFVCLRKDLADKFLVKKDLFSKVPKILMDFNFKEIKFKDIKTENRDRELYPFLKNLIKFKRLSDDNMSDITKREYKINSFFNYNLMKDDNVCNTICAINNNIYYCEERFMNKIEVLRASTFPKDYDFNCKKDYDYIPGMSVPPFMMKNISTQIYKQWLSKI